MPRHSCSVFSGIASNVTGFTLKEPERTCIPEPDLTLWSEHPGFMCIHCAIRAHDALLLLSEG